MSGESAEETVQRVALAIFNASNAGEVWDWAELSELTKIVYSKMARAAINALGGVGVSGESGPRVDAQEWVAQILRRDIVVEGSNVCMANVDRLAKTLVEDLYLDQWFETWEQPPDWLT